MIRSRGGSETKRNDGEKSLTGGNIKTRRKKGSKPKTAEKGRIGK